MRKPISFITRLEKKLQVSPLYAKANFEGESPHFNISIETTPSAFFLMEKYSWFNLHPKSRGMGHEHINRYRAVILDLRLNTEVLESLKDELDGHTDLLEYIRQASEKSPLLQTESWITWQIRQILPTINAQGQSVDIENKYPTLWAETEPVFGDVNLSQQLETLLRMLKWDFKKEANNSFLIDYYGEKGAWQCRITADNLQSICQFVSILPLKVPEERHSDMIQHLTKINQEATLAHFSFNIHTGEVVCKSAESFKNGEKLTEKRFVVLAESNTQMMDKHIEVLLKIADVEVPDGFKGFRKKVVF
ncbi:MAG: hypothetical protein ACPGVB_08180 [Chitinophagales bacterium]